MSEFITIQVGQCGNQIGSVFWPLALQEYGITNNLHSSATSESSKLDRSFKSFFCCPGGLPKTCPSIAELRKSKITARALLIDMEERVVDRFQSGGLHHLFDKKCSLTNHPGSGNNWAVGHHTHFHHHQSVLEDMIRHAVEQCDCLRGFLVLLSLGGGTGSGLGTAIVRLLDELFPRIDRLVTCVHPGQYTDVVTSPYNVAHSLRVLSEHASFILPVDNKALIDICTRHRLTRGVKPFQEANNIIVNMLLNLTCGSRFAGALPFGLSDLSTLVPQPGLQYFSTSLSPVDLSPPQDVGFVYKKRNLVQEVCARDDQLLRVNALSGHLLSAALLCRGNITLSTLREYVASFRSKVKFAPWSEPGIRTGLCSLSPIGHKSAMLCLANSTNMATLFSDSLKHFDLLYRRKAHVHHYTKVDGFEADDFLLTRESLVASAQRYLGAANSVDVPRLQLS